MTTSPPTPGWTPTATPTSKPASGARPPPNPPTTERAAAPPNTSSSPEPANPRPATSATDLVIEQSIPEYDDASNTILRTSYARLPASTGKGPLTAGGGTGSNGTLARRSYLALYPDGIGRVPTVASYGTNDDATLTRPAVAPAPSDDILVSTTTFDPDTGQPTETTAPDGTVNQTEYDDLGRSTKTIENVVSGGTADDENRTTEFGYTGGLLTSLKLVNTPAGGGTGSNGTLATTWTYGTSLTTSRIASNDLLHQKEYPGGDTDTTTYDRQGRPTGTTDGNGTVHAFDRDLMGALLHDRVTTLGTNTGPGGSPVDGTVRRLSFQLNHRRQLRLATSHDDATVGQGTIVNQVERKYSPTNCLIEDAQSHGGAVGTGTPKISYLCTNAAGGVQRVTSITLPDGRQVATEFGSTGSIDDALNRPASLHDADLTVLAEWTYAGAGITATSKLPEPDATLDQLAGLDRFGRIKDVHWQQAGTTTLSQTQRGHDRASRPTYKENLTSGATNQDHHYSHDGLGQVIDDNTGTLNATKTGITGTPTREEDFTYDPQGNWNAYDQSQNGTADITQTRDHNTDNQITKIDSSATNVAYDNAGNMTKVPTGADLKGSNVTLVWDAWNRLVEVKDDNDATIQTNAYDALQRRTTVNDGTDTRHHYYNDQWRPVETRLNSETDPTTQHIWHPEDRYTLLLRDRDTTSNGTLDERLYLLKDYLDPAAVIDKTGTVQERYAFTTFGRPLIQASDFTPRTTSAHAWDLLFHIEFEDPETGYHNYGYRFYIPGVGKWPSRDPIGERGGVNLYGFVGNKPSENFDNLGLAALAIQGQVQSTNIGDRFNSLPAYRSIPKNIGRYAGPSSCMGINFGCHYTRTVAAWFDEKIAHEFRDDVGYNDKHAYDASINGYVRYHAWIEKVPESKCKACGQWKALRYAIIGVLHFFPYEGTPDQINQRLRAVYKTRFNMNQFPDSYPDVTPPPKNGTINKDFERAARERPYPTGWNPQNNVTLEQSRWRFMKLFVYQFGKEATGRCATESEVKGQSFPSSMFSVPNSDWRKTR